MRKPTICRYCGGVIHLVPAKQVLGKSAKRLGLEGENLYQCQNCNARVGCHKGTNEPLGNVANETLRLKRMETHQIFDAFWKSNHMSRQNAYKWLSQQMRLPMSETHIAGFEMEQCQRVIELCGADEKTVAAIMDCAMTDDMLRLLDEAGLRRRVMESVMQKIHFHLTNRAGQMLVGAVTFSNVYGILGKTANADTLLKIIQEDN